MRTTQELLDSVAIAKYMGINPIKGVSENSGKVYYYYNDPILKDYEVLPTYKHWGELMPVVVQINKRDWVTIKSDECAIHSLNINEFDDIKIEIDGGDLLEIVYDAVLEYVNWFNQKNK